MGRGFGGYVRRVSVLAALAVVWVTVPAVPGGADPAIEVEAEIGEFVVIGVEGVEFDRGVRVVSGDVGVAAAGGVVGFDRDVVFEDAGSRLIGDQIELARDASVFDVYTNDLSGDGVPTGTVFEPVVFPLALELPSPAPAEPVSDDVTLGRGGTLVLEPGSYGVLDVGRDSTVTLTGGVYDFSGWVVDRGVEIWAAGAVEIRVAGSVEIGRDSALGPVVGAALDAGDVLVSLTGNGSELSVGRDSFVDATVIVVTGSVEFDRGVTVTGSVVANTVTVGRDSVFTLVARSVSGDLDGDGLPDELESYLGTSPLLADTDSDGLDDGVEFLEFYPWADPTVADTDGNGITDDADDIDGDGLSAVEELASGTDPLTPDTDGDGIDDAVDPDPVHADRDGDGLDDAAEERLGTDPAVADSDGDGIDDAADTHTSTVALGEVSVSLVGAGDLPGELHIADLGSEDPRPGSLIGSTYVISLPIATETVLESAVVTLPYDPSLVPGNQMDLRIFHWSDDVGMWLPAAGDALQVVDTTAHTVTAPTEHFSLFAIGDLSAFRDYWSQNSDEIAACEIAAQERLYVNHGGTLAVWDGADWTTAATAPLVNGQFTRFGGVVSDGGDVYTWTTYREFDIDALTSYVHAVNPSGGLEQIGSFERVYVRDLVVADDQLYALVEPRPLVSDSDGAGSELWRYHEGGSWTRVVSHSSGSLGGRAVVAKVNGAETVVWSHRPSYSPAIAPYSLVYSVTQGLAHGTVEVIPGRYSYSWGASFELPIPLPGTDLAAMYVVNSDFISERGHGGVFRSTNGLDWEERPAPGPIATATIHDGVPILGSFVVDYSYDTGESQDEAVYSFDGASFTTLNDTLNVRWSSAVSGGGFLYMSGAVHTVSPDGESPPGGVFRSLDGFSFEQILTAPIDDYTSRLAFVGSEAVDTDRDGLNDCLETVGLPTQFGIITTDPNNPDTDGDDLPDGLELMRLDLTALLIDGEPVSDLVGVDVVFPGWSNPLLADSDSDGLDDFDEFELGTKALSSDSDGDGLSDLEEANLGTDPRLKDTDGDSFDDAFEAGASDEGFDPTYFDEKVSKWSWVADASIGAVCGDALSICERDSMAWLAGNLGAGFFAVADLRDFIASVSRSAWIGAGLALLGVIPLLGDAVKASDTIGNFIRRIPPAKVTDSARWVIRQNWIPNVAKRSVIGLVDGADSLRARGVSDDVLVRLIGGNAPDLRRLDDVIEGAGDLRKAPRFFGDLADEGGAATRGAAGERFLREELGVADAFERVGIKTSHGARPGKKNRFPDAFTDDELGATIHEAKVGVVKWGSGVEAQILKDADIVAKGTQDTVAAVWHFFPSGVGDTIGADPRVLRLLRENGIGYVVWIP